MLTWISPKLPLWDNKCIFGDGIMNNTFNDVCDLNSASLGDLYHLLDSSNSSWRLIFKSPFSAVSQHLRIMINHPNESNFDSAFAANKKKF